MAADTDTTRTTVKTYVPAYQKAEWERHAEELDMSQSEFVRTMVQAGRRDISLGGDGQNATRDDPEPAGSDDLGERVREALASEGALDWDQLVARLTDDIERRLDDTMDELQRRNEVQYDGRGGGYTLIEDDGE